MGEEPKKELPGSLIAGLDQMVTLLENSGNLMGTYYKSLRDNGVPAKLAHQIVIDFNRVLWSKLGSGKPYE